MKRKGAKAQRSMNFQIGYNQSLLPSKFVLRVFAPLRLILFLLFPFGLMAGTAKQTFSFCYYDQETVDVEIPNRPNFLKNLGDDAVDKGMMVFYERKLFDIITVGSLYIGGDVGKWSIRGDGLFTTTAFFAGKMWLLHLPFLHTYLEYSLFGPTILSKSTVGDLDFGSNFLFQNFFGAGVEVGEGSGFSLDLKIIRFTKLDLERMDYAFHIPVIVSLGFLF
jgi:hypothetical protein